MIQRVAILTLAVSISLCSAAIANPGTEYTGTALTTDEYRFAVYDFLWGTGAEEGMIACVATRYHGCSPLRDSALDFRPEAGCTIKIEIQWMPVNAEIAAGKESCSRFHFNLEESF